MARLFDGIDDSIQASLNLSSTSVLSLAFWMYWDSFANDDDLAFEFTPNYNLTDGSFIVDPNAGGVAVGNFEFGIGSGLWTDYFTRPSGAAWHHYVLIMNRVTPVNVAYVDGVSQTLTASVHTLGGGNFANSTLNFMSRNNVALFADGRMAHVGIWNLALSASQASALASGYSPLFFRDGLLNYYKVDGKNSPEYDQIGNTTGAVVGAVYTDDPPGIFYPRNISRMGMG